MLQLLTASLLAQDPAHGWMAYAVGAIPSHFERITRLEMTWKVGADPPSSDAFFSPWFGMDPADNLNLIQPVNPWGGDGWAMYTEYFQWSPEHNSNSNLINAKAGQTLHGSLVYDKSSDSYELSQRIVETGEVSKQRVKCQSGKKFTVPYVVYEKIARCNDYPPDGRVTFSNITMECDGVDCAAAAKWQAKGEDANCNMKAHVDQYPSEISISWDTSMASPYDNHSQAQLDAINGASGWGKRLLEARRAKAAAA